ncbi:Uncharacterised protein [Mycobacterium xenopi]|nr:Uncharacterised protein [Mycobacterium xenopi]
MRHLNTWVRIHPYDMTKAPLSRGHVGESSYQLGSGVCTPYPRRDVSWRTRLTVAHTRTRYERTRETVI